MKRGALFGSILALGLGCQMALPENTYLHPHETAQVQQERQTYPRRTGRIQQQELHPEPIEETFFAQCHDGKYDFDSRCIDFTQGYVATAQSSIYLFNQTLDIESNGMRETKDLDGICSSTLIEEGYVITAQHCVDVSPPPFIRVNKAEFSISYNGKKYPLELIATGGIDDVALLRLKKPAELPYFPFRFGDSDVITPGNYVYLLGFSGNIDSNARDGTIGVREDTTPPDPGDGQFIISNQGNPGDSGGLVIGFRDGVPEMLGVLIYGYTRQDGNDGILKINNILKAIGKHLGY
ncbi:MAG: serine protease [Nanoarchaeota archaeon]|nr:serine protease [Nanoarchaeota archaeon]